VGTALGHLALVADDVRIDICRRIGLGGLVDPAGIVSSGGFLAFGSTRLIRWTRPPFRFVSFRTHANARTHAPARPTGLAHPHLVRLASAVLRYR
jgi:hypothetical protein